jgi:hypothetical protein
MCGAEAQHADHRRKEAPMNALAHNFALALPSDQANGEEPVRPSLAQGAIVVAAMTLGVFVLIAAVILKTAYDMLIFLWLAIGRPLAFALKTFSRAAGSVIRRGLPHVRRSSGGRTFRGGRKTSAALARRVERV